MPAQFEVVTHDAGKRFQKDWLFRNSNVRFTSPGTYAILGNNGSGKSTFLLCLAGFYALSEGKVSFTANGFEVADDQQYNHYTLISPALELAEDLTLEEFLHYHFKLRPLAADWSLNRIYEETSLLKAKDRHIRKLSSGMKQRLKLCMAFCTSSSVLFLDEPCTNLDQSGIDWYKKLVQQQKDRLIIVASNMLEEYSFCEVKMRMEEL